MISQEALLKFRLLYYPDDLRDNSKFIEFFDCGLELLELTDQQASSLFSVSCPTIRGWKDGTKIPFFPWKKIIYNEFMTIARYLVVKQD